MNEEIILQTAKEKIQSFEGSQGFYYEDDEDNYGMEELPRSDSDECLFSISIDKVEIISAKITDSSDSEWLVIVEANLTETRSDENGDNPETSTEKMRYEVCITLTEDGEYYVDNIDF